MRQTGDRGSAIALALVVVILVSGLVAALATYSFPFLRTSASFNQGLYARYAAEAALEEVRMRVASSPYDSVGNIWLMDNSAPAPGKLVYDDWVVGDAKVDVVIQDLGDQFYRAEATAAYGERNVTLVQEFRARDTFARYMFFVDIDSMYVGTSTVRGAVYTGKTLHNHYGGAKYYGSVEARKGISYSLGATAENTSYFDTVNDSAEQVKIPSTNEIATLHDEAEGVYRVSNSSPEYAGSGNMNAAIELLGDQVKIAAYDANTGALVKSGTYPLPSNGLIFVQGDVTSLKGDFAGRLTIATMGNVDIKGKIRYQDADGDLAYQLKKDGAVVPNNDPGNFDAWTEANGYQYQKNPNFNPPSDATPTLGVLAAKDVQIHNDAPWNMELQAAVFAATGRWYCSLDSVKGNLKVLGSLVQQKHGWRYSGATGKGWSASGEYVYDTNLLQAPPPFFLAVDKPTLGARWVELSQ